MKRGDGGMERGDREGMGTGRGMDGDDKLVELGGICQEPLRKAKWHKMGYLK